MPFSPKEVAEHNTKSSCWVIIDKKVYDVTDFVPEHPGGPRMIMNFAGRDASTAFKSFHSPDVLATRLPRHKHLGHIG
ncbi:cytochrome b5-like heme/steroid binding domain-containing protein [Fomitopsis serialis]|uniref:cytochrome b5-like heme/steroid binding domain-containing protein n=1 Tax=Fomitopsis serialis TaxID=139415 RepID=UPI002007BC2A|nr:cytochrome b5-like heme/steroid binding domain-containing protein [Neoantrodia serialis]KAH9926903.1 cytochrome b5-like heme/steroid binding domain-containing protein [Neoantrodia serialis]